MYVIKQGRKLNRAWKLYECPKCGERGITLTRDAAIKLFPRIKVSGILVESDDPIYKPKECTNCGTQLNEPSLFADKYKELFYHLNVDLMGNNTIHVITEDELYY